MPHCAARSLPWQMCGSRFLHARQNTADVGVAASVGDSVQGAHLLGTARPLRDATGDLGPMTVHIWRTVYECPDVDRLGHDSHLGTDAISGLSSVVRAAPDPGVRLTCFLPRYQITSTLPNRRAYSLILASLLTKATPSSRAVA